MLSVLIHTMRSCSACHMTTDKPEASRSRSSRTRDLFHSDNNTPCRYHTNCLATFLTQLTSLLMRELRHPCTLLHAQDRESRRRCTKPPRQCELLEATSLLSFRYLFCHLPDPLKVMVSSLSPAFTSAFLAFRNTVKQTFAFALFSRFPT
jgi:hypothetical protein